MLLIPALALGITLLLHARLQRLVRVFGVIDRRDQLHLLKDTTRTAMLGAMAQISLLFLPLLVFLYGITTNIFRLEDVLFVVIPGGLQLWFYVRYRQLETNAQAVRIDNQDILQEVIHVVETWKKKTLPDW